MQVLDYLFIYFEVLRLKSRPPISKHVLYYLATLLAHIAVTIK